MTEESTFSIREYKSNPVNLLKFRRLLEILVAFLPILILGIIGTSLGTDTFLGGMLVTLGYVLSIVVATIVLKLQGNSWNQIGLARPKSWPRPVDVLQEYGPQLIFCDRGEVFAQVDQTPVAQLLGIIVDILQVSTGAEIKSQ